MVAGSFRKRKASAVLLALLAMLVPASCTKVNAQEEYEAEMARVGASVDGAIRTLEPEGDRPVDVGTVRALAETLRNDADRVERIAPPREVRAPQREMVGGLRALATASDSLASELEDAVSLEAEMQAWLGFTESERAIAAFAQLDTARRAYARENYRVFGDLED